MADTKQKAKKMLSSFTILFIILLVVALASVVVSMVAPDSGVVAANLSSFTMAPVRGFADALDVCVFVMVLGGFLAIMTKTGALDTGIQVLVRSLHGKELVLIPVLMTIFSIGGTTYGMCEETVPFYLLLAATMFAAGFDPLVGAAIVLLGAGVGCLGSTVNPFAVGACIDSLTSIGIEVNQAIIIPLGIALWLASLVVAILFVMSYARKVKANKGSTILSLQEMEEAKAAYGEKEIAADAKLSGTQKACLIIFAAAFVVMVIGFIPWGSFGVTAFEGWSAFFTGLPLGEWYFQEATTWFLFLAILIGIVGKLSESEIVNTFLSGAGDMMSVVMVIAVARGVSVLMGDTGLRDYILASAANALQGMPAIVFAPLSYLLYIVLSFLIPSSSGMASASMPIMGPLAQQLGFSPEVMVQICCGGNGLVNLFTPTSGAIMGGLALARVQYSTWLKFAWKAILVIGVISIVILTGAMMIL